MATKNAAQTRRSADLFARIVSEAEQSPHCPSDTSLCEKFLRLYYADVEIGDLKDYSPEGLANAALSHLSLGAMRAPGDIRVRVYNPQLNKDNWRSPHTIIETVTADMPFLVGSITMVARQHDLGVHQTTHPVLAIRRNAENKIETLAPRGSKGGADESFVHLEVDRISGAEKLERIRQDVERSLHDVAVAVNDWTAMRDRAETIAYELDSGAFPLDPGMIEEGRHFLHWMVDNHFTFLGFREYRLEKHTSRDVLHAVESTGLGILRDAGDKHEKALVLSGELRTRARERELVVITKTNAISTVHRAARLDYIGFKRFDEKGEVCGEYRFLGLFTSKVYTHSPREIPLVRRKMQRILERSHLQQTGHAGKGLLRVLETLPRDELFQASEDELYNMALGVLSIQERSRVRLFVRRDAFGRFYSCLIYVPRERYNSTARERMQKILGEALKARGPIEAFVHMGESRLARVHLIVHTRPWQHARIGVKRLERELREVTRTWDDRLRVALIGRYGEGKGMQLFEKWGRRFPIAYQEDVHTQHALLDLRTLLKLSSTYSIDVRPYRPEGSPAGVLRLKVFSYEQPIILSDILPLLENMGMRIIAEHPYCIQLTDESIFWIHDFEALTDENVNLDLRRVGNRFREGFLALWKGESENDKLNSLILSAELDWHQVRIVRAYAKYLLQTGLPFGERYIEQLICEHPELIVALIRYFEMRFDPELNADSRMQQVTTVEEEIREKITQLSSQDEDRVLRALTATMKATLRTNHFLRTRRGKRRHYLSFKLESSRVPELPKPRPLYEIFVFAPHVEGIHLRGGPVARGGIRWSDRQADYRTEVLGLMKAQMVKNTVIVPVSSKGGFITKRLPKTDDRDVILTEVKRCYRDYMRGLLDITDNIVNSQPVHPQAVVCHDGFDPYLVVAADKGTASFSDLANEVAADYDFWLGDAFASGGSIGYDHKAMAITSRGAWESVRRLFGELGIDPEVDELTVVGIGDMSGDVFGNGMLLSKTLRLRAAFNHQHIFIDPDPDAASSFEERKRLFERPRSTWEDYDRSKISKGGGIYKRSAKTIKLSTQAREALGVADTEEFTPQQLIQAILKAPVDMLWIGGIGTYVKSSHENNLEVGDRNNDELRINGRDLRCKVVGEAGNLGLTQHGRIEFAQHGGRITTDFIDNSAGVDCSDHEVNIKILLNVVRDKKHMSETARRELLMNMENEVGRLVLRDNYLQSLALSVAELQSPSRLNEHAHLIRTLEHRGTLDRQLEFLPSEEEITERRTMGRGLTRPELAVLLAYSKISLYGALDSSALANDDYLKQELVDYFPSPLQKKYASLMPEHPLQAEIIATAITNSMVNRMGPTFPFRIQEETGVSMNAVAQAYTIAREALDMVAFWTDLEKINLESSARIQEEIIVFTGHLVRHATRWMLSHGHTSDIRDTVEFFREKCRTFGHNLPRVLSEKSTQQYQENIEKHMKQGFDLEHATRIAALPYLFSAFDIAAVSAAVDIGIKMAAKAYFQLGAELGFDWLREQIESLPADDHWKSLARTTLRDALYTHQRLLTIEVMKGGKKTATIDEKVAQWKMQNTNVVEHFRSVLSEIRSTSQIELASLSVAVQEAHTLARGGRRETPGSPTLQ